MTMDNADLEREEDSGIEASDTNIFIRISVPELKLQKCLQFSPDDTVWSAKQRVLSTLAKDLKDGLNYGLYCPPINGKAGKFLDEERLLADYPLPGPIGFLEFKYKRRVYKLMQINPKRLKQIHTKANLKQFIDHVRRGETEKVVKMANKGLDPNFHDHDSGECPMTVAAQLEKPRFMLISLVSGGAHVDFRNKAGLTAMHKAAAKGNYDAIKTLLDLGAGCNYKDGAGLSPLYLAVMHAANPHCVELLLHDHALAGTTDSQGWAEVHHACKAGRVQHLEHLLFYGADMNAQNSSGNTPLHVCAVNNQESCARVLLFRGCNRNVLNYANQDAFQVAVISSNTELAEIIKNFKSDDVVPFQEMPKYNEKRRAHGTISTISNLQRCRSNPSLHTLFQNQGSHPPSPVLSQNSLQQQYISNGSIYGGSSNHEYDSDSPRSMSISSSGSVTGSYVSERIQQRSKNHSDMNTSLQKRFSSLQKLFPFSRRTSVPDWTSASFSYNKQRLYPAIPGRTFVCIKNYTPPSEAELMLKKGQFVEVLSVGEGGYYEGKVDHREGWFPSNCVQEVHMRKGAKGHRNGDSDSVLINRQTLAALAKSDGENGPRSVVLQKRSGGFGFVLRGAKSNKATSTLDFSPTPDFPALQYLDRVEKNSAADMAGLKPGDFLLEINGESVVNATHEHTVSLIKKSKNTLAMKVVTVAPLSLDGMDQHMDGTRTLPVKHKKGVVAGHQAAFSPTAPTGPVGRRPRPPSYSLTPGMGAKAQTMIDGLAELEKLDQTLAIYDSDAASISSDYQAASKGIDPNNKTASIRRMPKRLSSVPLDDMFSSPSDSYSSPSMSQSAAVSTPNISPQHSKFVNSTEFDSQRTTHKSIVNVHLASSDNAEDPERIYAVPHAGKSKMNTRDIVDSAGYMSVTPIPPPPKGPAPVPPTSSQAQVVAIRPHYANVSAEISQYKKDSNHSDQNPYESSFRPGIGARLSKIPAVPPKVHSRTSSMSSSVSSMSEHSDRHQMHGDTSSQSSGLIVAADLHSHSKSSDYYEPEPDYEESGIDTNSWSGNEVSINTKVPAPSQASESNFTSAVRNAAVAREKKTTPQESPVLVHKTKAPSPPPAPPPPPLQPPPPPPPLNGLPLPPRDVPSAGPRKSSLPPHVQKQLEEKKKQEDSHHALLQAVAKRRNIVESADMDRMAESIESRIQKSKKLQTVVYKSDKTKAEIKPETPPAVPLLSSVRETSKSRPNLASVTDKSSENTPRKESEINTSTTTSELNDSVSSNQSSESPANESMLARAERMRQDYLKKKGLSVEKQDKKPDNQAQKSIPPNRVTPEKDNTPTGMGDLASVIAQRAARRQQSSDALENNNNNNTVSYKADQKSSTVKDTDADKVHIEGATVESSTDSVKRSVADRSKMFEGSRKSPPKKAAPPPPSRNGSHASSRISNGHGSYQVIGSKKLPSQESSHSSGFSNSESFNAGDIDVDFIPPPPVFDLAEDNGSNTSTGHGHGSSHFAFNLPPPAEEADFVLPAIAPPPPGFDDDGNDEMVPPPQDFDAQPSAASLRSVLRSSPSASANSMSFPAVPQPTKPFQSKSIEHWTVSDVSDWLESIQLNEHKYQFQRQGVNGNKLAKLGRTELISLGVNQVSHRMSIERGIKKATSVK